MASAETRGKPGLWEVRALWALGVVLGLYLSWAQGKKHGWGSDSSLPSRARPGECRAQINSLHSSGTTARTQSFLRALPQHHSPPSPSSLLSLSLVFSPPGSPPPIRSSSKPPKGLSRRPCSLRLSPHPPRPTAPGHGNCKECYEKPRARLRACALGRASPTPTTPHR